MQDRLIDDAIAHMNTVAKANAMTKLKPVARLDGGGGGGIRECTVLYRVPPFPTDVHTDLMTSEPPANERAFWLQTGLLLSVWTWRRHVLANMHAACVIECEDERNVPQLEALFERMYDHDDIDIRAEGINIHTVGNGDSPKHRIDMGLDKGMFTAALGPGALEVTARTGVIRTVGDEEDFDAVIDACLSNADEGVVCYATADTDPSVRARRSIAILTRLPPVSPQYA